MHIYEYDTSVFAAAWLPKIFVRIHRKKMLIHSHTLAKIAEHTFPSYETSLTAFGNYFSLSLRNLLPVLKRYLGRFLIAQMIRVTFSW